MSQKVDYSLYFLSALHGQSRPCSIRAIAQNGGISFSFLQKIAHLLKRAGLVAAVRGKVGGYVLAQPPQRITMKDVVEAVDGKIVSLSSCAVPSRAKRSCPRRNFCQLRSTVARIRGEIMGAYFSKKLSDVLRV